MPARLLLLLLLALLLPGPGVSDRGSWGGGHLGAVRDPSRERGGGAPRLGVPRRRLGPGVGGSAGQGANAFGPAGVAAAASRAEAHATPGASWTSAAVTGSASRGLIRSCATLCRPRGTWGSP